MDMTEKSFAELFEQAGNVNMQIHTGDKVKGTVISVGKDSVFVDLHARQDGVADIKDFMRDGQVTVKPGDEIECYVSGSDGEGIHLKTHLGGREIHEVDSAVSDAFANKIPIEGKVTGERKGGFSVQIASAEAFCPYSQIDARGVKKEGAEYLGQTYNFIITECSEDGYSIVVSRRRVLEEEAAAARTRLLANLKEGDVLDGTVSSLMPYGAFVDLGGIEGMVHVSELSWDRGIKPEDVVKIGDRVVVKVLSYEAGEGKNRDRISLSLKQAQADPWESFVNNAAFAVGTKHTGKVTRLASFGAFILIAPAVEGLAHISQLGADHRIEDPSEAVKAGQEVEVTILGVDNDRRRVSLCVGEPRTRDEKPAELTAVQEQEAVKAAVSGQTLEGEVEKQAPFGLFVKLPNGQTGLLHISQLKLGGDNANTVKERQMFRKYPLHSKIEVVVRSVDGDRISLTTPETLESETESSEQLNVKDTGSTSFGSLDALFNGLNL